MLVSKRKTIAWVWNRAQRQGEKRGKPDELQGSGGETEPERLKGGL